MSDQNQQQQQHQEGYSTIMEYKSGFSVNIETDELVETIDVFDDLNYQQKQQAQDEMRSQVIAASYRLCAVYGFGGFRLHGEHVKWLHPMYADKEVHEGVAIKSLSHSACIAIDAFMKTRVLDLCNRAIMRIEERDCALERSKAYATYDEVDASK